ncbi:MAG: nucleoside hydrolase-like domain-containing protein [Planctomycetota bacterium]
MRLIPPPAGRTAAAIARAVSSPLVAAALAGSVSLAAMPAAAQFDPRPRLLVTTDIGGDPDDQQSLIRLLAHADAFRIEGLIASARGTPGEGGDAEPQPQQIEDRIEAYGLHLDTLRIHNPAFPDTQNLLSKVESGTKDRGLSKIGVGEENAGARAIEAAVDASSEPLHVAIWGGATELAQAMVNVQNERSPGEVQDFVAKLRVHAINDQDGYVDANEGTLAWIKQEFPTMLIIDPTPAGAASDDLARRFDSTYRGMYQNDSTNGADTPIPLVSDDVAALTTQAWIQENVNQNHGALGALYPDNVIQNPQTDRNTIGFKEGDTPSWFSFFPNGLADPDDPALGNWGGRYQSAGDGTNHFVPAFDTLPDDTVTDEAARSKWTIARYREAYQNEFANRMDWFVAENFADANHPPTPFTFVPSFPKRSTVSPGGSAFLFSDGWFDPDGDDLTYTWWLYEDAGTGVIPESLFDALDAANVAQANSPFLSPLNIDLSGIASGSELHFILEVTDADTPLPFTRYERFIVTVGTRIIPEPATGLLALSLPAMARRRR